MGKPTRRKREFSTSQKRRARNSLKDQTITNLFQKGGSQHKAVAIQFWAVWSWEMMFFRSWRCACSCYTLQAFPTHSLITWALHWGRDLTLTPIFSYWQEAKVAGWVLTGGKLYGCPLAALGIEPHSPGTLCASQVYTPA